VNVPRESGQGDRRPSRPSRNTGAQSHVSERSRAGLGQGEGMTASVGQLRCAPLHESIAFDASAANSRADQASESGHPSTRVAPCAPSATR